MIQERGGSYVHCVRVSDTGGGDDTGGEGSYVHGVRVSDTEPGGAELGGNVKLGQPLVDLRTATMHLRTSTVR
eukprot:8121278-Pyramimonas_sp.AAC.1